MSRLARTLLLGAMLAAMNLAGMTTVAQAHAAEDTIKQFASAPLEPHAGESYRHGERASQEQTAADAALRRVLAQEHSYSFRGTPAQVPAPVRSAEPSGQPGWLIASLGVLAAALALVAGLAVMAARRASRKVRAGQAA